MSPGLVPSNSPAMKSYSALLSHGARTAVLLLAAFLMLGSPGRADVVFAWNEALLHYSSGTAGRLRPHLEARAFAAVHLAMQEALRSLPARPRATPESQLAAQRVAVVVAAHEVLTNLLPSGRPMFDALKERHLASVPAGDAREAGGLTGRAAAARVLQARESDGWTGLAWFDPAPDVSDQAAAAAMRGESAPRSPWLKARPFGLKSARQIEVRELRAVKSNGEIVVDPQLQFPRLFDGLDAAEAMEAREGFWAAPPLVAWNRVARQATVGREMDLAAQASLLAALNVALADATLSAAHWRYEIGSWRSVSADAWVEVSESEVRATDVVARIDQGLYDRLVRQEVQRIVIRPTPNHPALAATLAGAAQATLERWFGSDAVAFTLPMNPPPAGATEGKMPLRRFGSFSAAAKECALVITLDGTSTRESSIAGYLHGHEVGKYLGGRELVARR